MVKIFGYKFVEWSFEYDLKLLEGANLSNCKKEEVENGGLKGLLIDC